MHTHERKILSLLLLIVAVAGYKPAFAQHMMHPMMDYEDMPYMMGYGMGYGMGPMMYGWDDPEYGMGPGRMMRGLQLNEDQRKRMRKLMQDMQNKHSAMRNELFQATSELDELLESKNPDAEKVGKAYLKISKLRQQLAEDRMNARKQMLDVLTKEQREQLESSAGPGYGWRHRMMWQ